MKTFDLYEFTAILLPGAILLFGIALLYPQIQQAIALQNTSLGELGLFIILAYASGHLVQALGNVLEWILWKTFGNPITYILKDNSTFLSSYQRKQLPKHIEKILKLNTPNQLSSFEKDKKGWDNICRQMFIAVKTNNQAQRLELFVATYGLFRGMSISFILLIGCTFFQLGLKNVHVLVLLILLTILSLYRMNRFSKSYARELFLQFLLLK